MWRIILFVMIKCCKKRAQLSQLFRLFSDLCDQIWLFKRLHGCLGMRSRLVHIFIWTSLIWKFPDFRFVFPGAVPYIRYCFKVTRKAKMISDFSVNFTSRKVNLNYLWVLVNSEPHLIPAIEQSYLQNEVKTKMSEKGWEEGIQRKRNPDGFHLHEILKKPPNRAYL